MTSVISVQNLGKKYILSHQSQERYTALRDVISNAAKRVAKKIRHPFATPENDATHEEFWALKDVSFDIRQGDRVGIIGRNGAGKSTLLKVLSRIIEPTTGQVKIKGRVASLLEVGTGFHPELTGRENIYLNGAILGMGKVEISRKFDEIVAFAEIEKFLDTPVKRYSSGMYVRLAFAVAAHLEPEILIVDEVLAVGDSQFQQKCMGKMEEVGKEGRTVLFVSHNMAIISNLCQKGILLDAGGVAFAGAISPAIHQYYQSGKSTNGLPGRRIGSDLVELRGVDAVGLTDALEITLHDELIIRVRYEIKKDMEARCVPNFHFYTSDGSCAFISNATDVHRMSPGVYQADCVVRGGLLNEGAYFIGVAVTSYFDSGSYQVDFFEKNSLTFNVLDPMDERSNRYGYAGPVPGAVRPKLNWHISREE